MRRTLSALALTLALQGLSQIVVLSHARLERAEPQPNSVLAVPPTEVRIWFTQELTLSGNALTVVDAEGIRVDSEDARVDQADPDRKQLAVTLQPLSPGAYIVTWTSSSAEDGHPATDTFPFTVGPAGVESAPQSDHDLAPSN